MQDLSDWGHPFRTRTGSIYNETELADWKFTFNGKTNVLPSRNELQVILTILIVLISELS